MLFNLTSIIKVSKQKFMLKVALKNLNQKIKLINLNVNFNLNKNNYL